MPPSGFNKQDWPESGPHRDLLELLDRTHRRHGCRSMRVIGNAMHLSHPRVHAIVRGESLPVDEDQTRALVAAVAGRNDEEVAKTSDRAVELFVRARQARDGFLDETAPAAEAADSAGPRGSTGAGVGTVPRPTSAAGDGDVGAPPSVAASASARPSGRLLWTALGIAAVVLVGAGAWTTLRPTPDAGTEVMGAETTSSVVLQDSFDTPELDPQKWRAPNRADLIRPAGGELNMTVGPSDTTAGVEAELLPSAVDGFREIAFVTAVPAYTRSGPGGGALTLRETDGRTHRVLFGPSAGGPEIAVLVCSRPVCSQYDDYDPPARYESYEVGEKVPVRIVQTDGQLQFYVRDALVAQGPRGDAPLATFSFDLYGAKSEAWHLTVDSVLVSR